MSAQFAVVKCYGLLRECEDVIEGEGKMKEWKNDKGFSLLELVVAVGILMVLSVGGLLAYSGIQKNARVAAVQKAASEVFTGATAYRLDNQPGSNGKQAQDEWNGSRSGEGIEVAVDESASCLKVIASHVKGEEAVRQSGDCSGGDGSTAPTVPGSVAAASLTRTCSYYPGILGIDAQVRVYFAVPEGYTLEDVRVEVSTAGLGSARASLTGFDVVENAVELSDGSYRLDVPTNLLGGLLGLGSELEIALYVEDGDGVQSERVSVASNAGLLAGIGGSCRNLSE